MAIVVIPIGAPSESGFYPAPLVGQSVLAALVTRYYAALFLMPGPGKTLDRLKV